MMNLPWSLLTETDAHTPFIWIIYWLSFLIFRTHPAAHLSFDSPSPCMWIVPQRSWPLTSVTLGKSRGHPDGRPSGSWCHSFPGPGWWSQVQSGFPRRPSAPCGSPAPSLWVGSGLFRWCFQRQMSPRLKRGICAAFCAGGGQFHERRKRLGGRPHMETQSHILEIKDVEGRRGKEREMWKDKWNTEWKLQSQHPQKRQPQKATKSSLLMWTY